MDIVKSGNCTGCELCKYKCPQKCIEMKKNEYGELVASVNEDKCISCGLCEKVCIQNSYIDKKQPINCFAAWRTDAKKREKSASGGIAAILAENTIKNGGIVYGTTWLQTYGISVIRCNNYEQIEKLKGSRYVQSHFEDNFISIKKDLIQQKKVLVFGVPCQIAAIKQYLDGREYDNLVLVDLICHGVCPETYLYQEIECLGYNVRNLDNVVFRGQDNNYNYHLSFWEKEQCLYNQRGKLSNYLLGFIKGITLRESCYSCQFATEERVGDITLGDFIGLGKLEAFPYPKKSVSVVLTNNDKGNKILSGCNSLKLIERKYSETKFRDGLNGQCKKHFARNRFLHCYINNGYSDARKVLNKYIPYEFIKMSIGYAYRKVKGLLGLNM